MSKKKEFLTCEQCGSKNLDIRDDDSGTAVYDKYTDTKQYDVRGICQDCGYDNYIESMFTKLSDGTMVKEI